MTLKLIHFQEIKDIKYKKKWLITIRLDRDLTQLINFFGDFDSLCDLMKDFNKLVGKKKTVFIHTIKDQPVCIINFRYVKAISCEEVKE